MDKEFQMSRIAETWYQGTFRDPDNDDYKLVWERKVKADWKFDGGAPAAEQWHIQQTLRDWEEERRSGDTLEHFIGTHLGAYWNGYALLGAYEKGDTLVVSVGIPESDASWSYSFLYQADTLVLIKRW